MSDLEAATVDMSVDDVIGLMSERNVRRIPVLDNGQPVGIVSLGDLAVQRDRQSLLGDIDRGTVQRLRISRCQQRGPSAADQGAFEDEQGSTERPSADDRPVGRSSVPIRDGLRGLLVWWPCRRRRRSPGSLRTGADQGRRSDEVGVARCQVI